MIKNETAERIGQVLLLVRPIMGAAAGVGIRGSENWADDACSYHCINIDWITTTIIDNNTIHQL